MNRLIASFRRHRALMLFTALYAIIIIFAALAFGASVSTLLGMFGYLVWGLFASAFFFMAILLFYLLGAARGAPRNRNWLKSTVDGFEAGVADYLASDRFADAVTSILILFPVSFLFCIGKSLIQYLHPYSFDPALATFDHALHGGHYPHELLLPWVDRNDLTGFFDQLYLTWFVVLYVVLEFCIFVDPDPRRRHRFIWAYCLCWIIAGNLLAVAFSSVGPLFFHDFYPQLSNPYAGLTAHLQAQDKIQPLDVLKVAQLEIQLTRSGHVIDINALSAMPSMHMAMAALMFLYMRTVNRWAALFLLLYFPLLLIASIILGWHYAIDGYVGTALAGVIWWACGYFSKRTVPTD